MKKIKFCQNLVDQIINGQKTTTWRLFDDKDLQLGDKLEFIVKETNERFIGAEITGIREKTIKDIEESDFDGHEKYESLEEMLKTYRKYYGDRVNLETPVKIISFKLL